MRSNQIPVFFCPKQCSNVLTNRPACVVISTFSGNLRERLQPKHIIIHPHVIILWIGQNRTALVNVPSILTYSTPKQYEHTQEIYLRAQIHPRVMFLCLALRGKWLALSWAGRRQLTLPLRAYQLCQRTVLPSIVYRNRTPLCGFPYS